MLYSPLYGKISFDEPLSAHTTMKVGGPCRVWIRPKTPQQLCELAKLRKNCKIFTFTIGSGSNIIIGSDGIDGICIKLDEPFFKKIEFKKTTVKVGAGVLLNELLDAAMKNSLGGYEFLAGIPGTIAGAISGNAGTQNKPISSVIEEIEVVDSNADIKRIKTKDIRFGYRYSGLKNHIIVSAAFRFRKNNKNNARALLRLNLMKKIKEQDYTAPNAGCIFKNPQRPGFSAGQLIDRCGLKGKTYGGAQVSARHANFIINRNNAKPEDIFSLIRMIKETVRKKYNISLEEEVKIINEK